MLFYVGLVVLFSKYLYHKAHATKFSAVQQSQAHFSHALVWQQPNPVDVTSPTHLLWRRLRSPEAIQTSLI